MEMTREPAAGRSLPLILTLFQPGMESLMTKSQGRKFRSEQSDVAPWRAAVKHC